MNAFRAAAVDEAGRLVSPATRADVEKLAREASAGSVASAASSAEAAESSATQASSSASQAVTSVKAADTSAKASAASAAQADTSAKAAAGSATQADTSAKASAASAAQADTSAKAADGSATQADTSAKASASSASAAASSASRAEGAATTLNADAREFGDRVRSGEFTGDAGPANVLSIGTVSSLPPGSKATASIVGESPSQVLNLGLVEGPEGKASTVPGPPGALANASSYVIVGPGRPDVPSTTAGTITGAEPVGAEYRSTDGAGVGAERWIKRSSGWRVSDGDTGWRELPAGITSGNVLMNRVRRVGQSVFFMGRIRNDTGALISWPKIVNTRPASGFNIENIGANTPPLAIYLNDTLTDASWTDVSWITSAKHFPAGANFYWRFSWTTADPWPTAPLPGTPA